MSPQTIIRPPFSNNSAVLINAESTDPAVIPALMAEVVRFGKPRVTRAYGDWTTLELAGWNDLLSAHAIQPIQQFRYADTVGHSDAALIIDAMDLLYREALFRETIHTQEFQGFCLVSSDASLTRLATRIREYGSPVYGFGKQSTPDVFIKACDRFIFTEFLGNTKAVAPLQAERQQQLELLLVSAVRVVADEDGWTTVGVAGIAAARLDPSFYARNYGFENLLALMKGQPCLEVKSFPSVDGSPLHWVRAR